MLKLPPTPAGLAGSPPASLLVSGWCLSLHSLRKWKERGCWLNTRGRADHPTLCCRYITGTHTRGLWLAYFLAQPPLIAAERVALAALKRRGVLLPNGLRIALTVGTQVVLGHWLFWSPVAGEVAGQVIGNIEEGLRQAAGMLLRGM